MDHLSSLIMSTSRPTSQRLSSADSNKLSLDHDSTKEPINDAAYHLNTQPGLDSGEALNDEVTVENPQGRHMGVLSAAFLMINRIVGTGVFATTSTLLSQSGSVGMSLLYWVIGALIAGAGFAVYAEFATAMPRNGGELNYLQRAYRKPKHLVMIMYASQALLLGQAAGNAYTAGRYFIRAGGGESSEWGAKGIGIGILLAALIMHGTMLKWGLLFQKYVWSLFRYKGSTAHSLLPVSTAALASSRFLFYFSLLSLVSLL